MIIENLKNDSCKLPENEISSVNPRTDMEELNFQCETEQNDSNASMKKCEERSSQTIDNIVYEKNREGEGFVNKIKPCVSQIESLKTEIESLRKVNLIFFNDYCYGNHVLKLIELTVFLGSL